MASISDVARLAGCSVTLVSRVINNQYGVSEKSRQRIREAIDELGYTPNAHARSLVLKKTNTIGVVVDTLCDAYFFDLIKGIEDELDRYEYDVLFCSGKNDAKKKNNYINFFMQGRTDGLILYGSYRDDIELIHKLESVGFPFSLVEFEIENLNVNNIILDNRYGSQLAVDHLFSRGCKRIYHVEGDTIMQASEKRCEGYIEAMKAHNADDDDIVVLKAGWSVEAGYETIRSFLSDSANQLPDAFYFSSDQAAFGGIRALKEAGYSVPDDVMVVGFDDDSPRNVADAEVPLTTLRQPLYEMGQKAIEVLIREINEKPEKKEKCIFKPELIIRESTIPRK